jgi:exosome complex RNA-binding protein Rrp42 (RNase PH superfamily)
MFQTPELALSGNERAFVLKALQDGVRVDGRRPFDTRELKIACSSTVRLIAWGLSGRCNPELYSLEPSVHGAQDPMGGHVEVLLGETRVLAAVSIETIEPFSDRCAPPSPRLWAAC